MQPLPVVYAQNLSAVDALISHYAREVDGTVQAFRFRPGQGSQGANGLPVVPDALDAIDWSNTITRFVASALDLFANFSGDPAQKKAAVITAALKFYHDVVGPMIAKGVGRPVIFNALVNPLIEAALPRIVGGVYDALIRIFDKKTANLPALPPAPVAPPVAPNLPAGFDPY